MMLQCRAKEKDMAELFGKKYTNRTRFTRMCIGEAVFSLMDKKPYEEIRVSDIVKRAGVSRMTAHLRRAIADLDAGNGKAHELIEVEDE